MRGCPPFLFSISSPFPLSGSSIRGGEVLGDFRALLKVFKLFSKNFWEAYPALTRGFGICEGV